MDIHSTAFVKCPDTICHQCLIHILSMDPPSCSKFRIRPFSFLEHWRAFVARHFPPLPLIGSFGLTAVLQYCHGNAIGGWKVTSPGSVGPEGCPHPGA